MSAGLPGVSPAPTWLRALEKGAGPGSPGGNGSGQWPFEVPSQMRATCRVCVRRDSGRRAREVNATAALEGDNIREQAHRTVPWSGLAHPSPKEQWLRSELLSRHSTWGIGGKADFLVEVGDVAALKLALSTCMYEGLPYIVIGKGSNCLFDSAGFRGCVILNRISFKQDLGGGKLRVGAGYPFNQLGVECSKAGLSGLEFASGIPGTVGGAVFMNAGAGGQETCKCLRSVEVILPSDGGTRVVPHTISASDVVFGYRFSSFQEGGQHSGAVIVGAEFELREDGGARAAQVDYMNRRRKTQPLCEMSAGSVFRNPSVDVAAGALIDKCGLKGMSIGSAEVSRKHANFFINTGDCSSTEMLELIRQVKLQVEAACQVSLQEEIRYISPDGFMPWRLAASECESSQ